MHNKIILSLFVFTVSLTFAFIIPPGPGRIVGGLPANIKKFPHQISLQAWDGESHFCGGSIIGDRWILTAAHCTVNAERSYYIRVGSTYHAEGGHIFNVSRVINHPKFDPYTFNYDISLLELVKPITIGKSAAVINLIEQDREINTKSMVTVSGWGYTLNESESRDGLRFVQVNTIDLAECAARYSGVNTITDNMFCANVEGGGKDACKGDSGGPVIFNDELVGIVSWGEGCALDQFPGVYTRISAFRNWIREHTDI